MTDTLDDSNPQTSASTDDPDHARRGECSTVVTDPLRPDGGQADPSTDEVTPDDTEELESDGKSIAAEKSRDLTTTLEWAGVVILGLLAVIATFRFYNAASRAIGRLVSAEYEPLFQAGFNLVILLLAVAGISVLTRRLVLDR